MIEIKNKQILIDGKPRLLIGGEVHYFRLKREEWQDRITKLKAANCNAVASYIPWLCHEPVEGKPDVTGSTRPELDLGAFIDLCKENGLYFLARPGPFIMAEMKNEGLPYWVYTKHPDVIPVTWDGKPAPTRTLDYLAPGFLQEARHWYEAVMPVLRSRLQPNGGNIIAVQLDNEVGMLSWISNSPDLTDNLLDDFVAWLQKRYDPETLTVRYPFPLDNPIIRNREIRSPREEFSGALMRDLGHYMRNRFARYIATLRGYAEEMGVTGVPFVINIHGTDAGRGFTYPVGISQLYESYTQGPGYISGSDHYIGNLTMLNFQDLYLMNAFTGASNNPDQPLTSVEFEAGSGDYSGSHGGRHDPSAADFKTRICVAQGNRLLNYYLFTGGVNYLLDESVDDGNDRIAFTGERHGTAAPVNPEGELNYTYPRLARSVNAMLAVGDKLAFMEEQRDPVTFAFIPDYYMTEYKYPSSDRMQETVANLEANRGLAAWENVARAMLLGGYRFGAIDIQNRPLDPETTRALVLPSARYMHGDLQQKIVDYLNSGGGALLYGEVPQFDMEGNPCTLLAEALGLRPAGSRQASAFYYLSLRADGWAAPHAEVRTHFAQVFEQPGAGEVILRVVGTDEACGFDIRAGKGRAIVVATTFPSDVPLFRAMLERLGATASLRHDDHTHGIFMTTAASKEGERFLHLLNLDGLAKQVRITDAGTPLFDGRPVALGSREALMLPLNVSFNDIKIIYSTAEIARVEPTAITFRLAGDQDMIALETSKRIAPSDDYEVTRDANRLLITSRKHAALDDQLAVHWS
ncbi:MAG: beta-galactosidase [Chloroflexia bacterium]